MNRLPILLVAAPAVFAMLGGAATAPSEGSVAPPDGTYVYELSRDGVVRGKTTVVVRRRTGTNAVDVSEVGGIGEAYARVAASYANAGADTFEATYRAPFLRTWQSGLVKNPRPRVNFYDDTTIRYRTIGGRIAFDIDGKPGVGAIAGDDGKKPVPTWIFDAPFMTGVITLPAFVRRTGADRIVAFSAAFASDVAIRPLGNARATPQFATTPKTDGVVSLAGLATIWFDPASTVVHEAHFSALNIDARLVSHARATATTAFAPPTAPTPQAIPPGDDVTIEGDGVKLAGSLARPPGVSGVPAVVLVPPGPRASRNFDPQGPESIFVGLTQALVARGFAVLRYDTRGVGKSGGSQASQTWDASAADAEAALRYLQDADGIDAQHVYVLGYGSGADFAFASASSPNVSESVAGVVALAPTVLAYRECLRRDRRESVRRAYRLRGLTPPGVAAIDASLAANTTSGDANALVRSYLTRDPVPLAERNRAPALIFHPGLPTCGENAADRAAYDDRLTIANPRTTIVMSSDLSARFGDRIDADSLANTEAIFPYRFDASTVSAIADWLASPKTSKPRSPRGATVPAPRSAPPPPPPVGAGPALATASPATTPRPRPTDAMPGAVTLPSTFGATAAPLPLASFAPFKTTGDPSPAPSPSPAARATPRPNPSGRPSPAAASPTPSPRAS